MQSIRLIAVAGAAVAMATAAIPMGAAFAKEKTPQSDQQQYRVVKHDGKVLYCTTMEAATGSRVPRQVCNTAKEWRAQGVTLNTGDDA